mmetsp:Transcript_5598/g.4810  ORF Transcript_5598/g.4810 Transcript_5598/m.4810 type:complete len:99 (+) Transcript_5598:361-657(+)
MYIFILFATLLFYSYLYVKFFLFSLVLVPIFHIAFEGPVKTKLRRLEDKGRKLVKISLEEDSDKIFLQTLDKYLLLAIQSEVETEIDKNKDLFGCTKE